MLEIAPRRNRDKIKEVVKLYEDRKIPNIKTAFDAVSQLVNPSIFKKADKTYQDIKNKYSEATPLTGIIQRTNQKLAEKNNALKLNKSVNRLRKMKEFNDASKIKLKISNIKTAFNDRVFNIYIEPEQIGSFVATDIGAILGKAYLLSLKQIPKNSDFLMYSDIELLADLRSCIFIYF
jgi:hypothetical protein